LRSGASTEIRFVSPMPNACTRRPRYCRPAYRRRRAAKGETARTASMAAAPGAHHRDKAGRDGV